jgi:hypothetical protein
MRLPGCMQWRRLKSVTRFEVGGVIRRPDDADLGAQIRAAVH